MKATGIVRNIDNLGRIVIPIELRKRLNIDIKDPVEVFMDKDSIVIKKYNPECMFCGSLENITEYKGKKVCESCLNEVKEK